MKIGVRTLDGSEDRLVFAKQIGADGGSIWLSALSGYKEEGFAALDPLLRMKERFEAHGLELCAGGLGAKVIKNQLLGRPDRDREIEKVCKTVGNMGRAGVSILIVDQRLTYWAPGVTANTGYAGVPAGRGGSVLTSFDAGWITEPDQPCGQVSQEQAWERIAYFYERVVPVAQEAGVKLATHPDDPPMDRYRGVRQVLNGFAGLKRLVEQFDHPCNGVLLCLGTMAEAGEDVFEMIRYFGRRKRVSYVHFRNVRGTVPKYQEVFQDEGDVDMAGAMRALKEVDFDGWLVNDHCPGLLGDSPWAHRSLAWQVGYIRGLMQAVERNGQAGAGRLGIDRVEQRG